MDLVDEEDGAVAVPRPEGRCGGACLGLSGPQRFAGLGDDATEVGDAGGDGRERDEAGVRALGDDAGEGGLAGAGRAPEDDRGELPGLDEASQQLAFSDDVLLAHVVVQGAGPHAGSERRAGRVGGGSGGGRLGVEEAGLFSFARHDS